MLYLQLSGAFNSFLDNKTARRNQFFARLVAFCFVIEWNRQLHLIDFRQGVCVSDEVPGRVRFVVSAAMPSQSKLGARTICGVKSAA